MIKFYQFLMCVSLSAILGFISCGGGEDDPNSSTFQNSIEKVKNEKQEW